MGHGSTTRTQTSRAGLYTKGRPHTHTIYFIRCPTSVQRRGPVWFRPSPVAHRLASASAERSLPESPLPPSPPSSFIVRVEVGRDRHAQKAGSGGRAVAIDSAAVTLHLYRGCLCRAAWAVVTNSRQRLCPGHAHIDHEGFSSARECTSRRRGTWWGKPQGLCRRQTL